MVPHSIDEVHSLIGVILGATASVKVAFVSAASLVAGVGYSAWLTGQASGGDVNAGTLIPAASLTATSGALVYVVKKMAAGDLVHRDPATAEAQLVKLVAESVKREEASEKREEILTSLLVKQMSPKPADE